MNIPRRLLLGLSIVVCSESLSRGDFPQFRGTGGAAKTIGNDIPLDWSETKNLAWKVPIPGTGWSQPIIIGDKLFVSSAVADKDLKPKNFANGVRTPQSMGLGGLTPPPKVNIQWQLHCFECQSGEKLWSTTICEGQPRYPVHPSNTYATETPAANDNGIVVFFGATGVVAGVNPNGEVRWKQELGVFPTTSGFGTGSSVAILNELAYVQHFTENSSSVIAFATETGEKKWTHERAKKGTSWASPIVWRNNLRTEVVVSGGELLESLDPQTGAVLWRLENVKAPTACSVASDSERIYFGGSDPMSKGPLFSLLAGADGDLSPEKKNGPFQGNAWIEKKAAPGMSSPVSTSRFVFVNDNNVLRVYDATNGKKVNERRIDGLSSIAASPIQVDDRILYLDEQGNAVLVNANESCEVVGQGKIEDTFWSTPAVANNAIYLRGLEHLYCIRKTP
ncbi:MAG: PQQ-binding-like beta-propeller repeat protein [Pirellula sp.]|jgi:outer membrane protein assembly factor BamB|nr:PQQ-binding-like beta-propeller repeat protein [Pirellula sp.]